jgi:drug/metabolite transporter (DMT)-like permease
MSSTLAAILVAIVAYAALDISKVYQRTGLALRKQSPLRGWVLWWIATIITLSPPFAITFYAMRRAPVSLIGAMAGTGLALVAVYSRVVRKERLGFYRRMGVVSIVVATGLIGWFGGAPSTRSSLTLLLIVLAITSALFIAAWAMVHGSRSGTGPTIAAFAGALSGFVALFQKAATTETAQNVSLATALNAMSERLGIMDSLVVNQVIGILGNPYGATWIVLSIGSMFVLQFSYRWGTVAFIMPAFTALMVLVPIIGGVVLFGEVLPLVAWLGVLLMIAGVVMTSLEGRPDPDVDEMRLLGLLKRKPAADEREGEGTG